MSKGNVLYYGDNLDVLRRHVGNESVDLIYLDPPFNSNADYNVLFAEHGEKAAAQVQAFTDTWTWDTDARADYEEIVEAGGRAADAMRAFYTMLGGSDVVAYLARMSLRLVELHRVLKPTGSLYLHCDPTASHYLKIVLDAIFDPRSFQNEIAWCYRGGGSSKQRFGRRHDTILFYAKNVSEARFNADAVRIPYQAATSLKRTDASRWGKHRGQSKVYQPHALGKVPEDWWPIDILNANDPERLGYPTQKPRILLERIIAASSNPGDVVLDPFCGCGTTIDAAQELGRQWIGIDVTHLAIGLIKHRLVDRYGAAITDTYRVVGEPTTTDDAAVLAREDPFQFQAWALGLVGARVAGSDKKGGDKGIDGRLFFHDSANGPTRQIIFSVKAGHVVPTFVDALWGVVEREKAEIGVLISFNEPSPGMRSRAAEAGFFESPWGKHPRIQLRTIRELLDGKRLDYPAQGNVTLRRARKARPVEPERLELFGAVAEEPEPYSPSN